MGRILHPRGLAESYRRSNSWKSDSLNGRFGNQNELSRLTLLDLGSRQLSKLCLREAIPFARVVAERVTVLTTIDGLLPTRSNKTYRSPSYGGRSGGIVPGATEPPSGVPGSCQYRIIRDESRP
jgi:hypothetical protein